MNDLGRVGVWGRWFRDGDPVLRRSGCAEIEALGYGAIWMPGGAGGADFFDALELALSVTRRIVVGAGILNIFGHSPEEVGRRSGELHARYPGRFLLGLGVSHAKLMPGRYRTPLASMAAYLDALDRDEATQSDKRCLAALGPKMVEMARERSLGVHSYNVTVTHTRETRARLGTGRLLAPELLVAEGEDAHTARTAARGFLGRYLDQFENYVNNLRRLGYDDPDFTGGGSDRLIDDLIAWGKPAAIAEKVSAHLAAGADHVCVQFWAGPGTDPRPGARRLAAMIPVIG